MRRLTVLALAGALLVLAVPASATTDVSARNFALLRSIVGEDADLAQTVTFADGTTMSLREALYDAAARAGNVDLASLAAGQVQGTGGPYVGDIWVIAAGPGPCTIVNLGPSPLPPTSLHPQLYTYPGQTGTLSGFGYYVMVIAWTMKMSEFRFNAGYQVTGVNDNYCFNVGGEHFAFPFANGVFTWT